MSDECYENLADALDRLPNGYPRTPSNIEVSILKKIFSPDEAWLAGQLSGEMELTSVIAARAELKEEETTERLKKMAKSGFVWSHKADDGLRFRLAPFVVGIYEASLENMDHELAHLVEDYLANGGAAGIMKPQPGLQRVVPAMETVKTEWIMPYEDVREMLVQAKSYRVRDCICRTQKDHLGRECDNPVHNCLTFSSREPKEHKDAVTQEQALALLDQSEEIGLVHSVSNFIKGVSYVCNCCGCCCGILRGITEWGFENSMAASNYYAVINADECTNCAICVDRCQVEAISDADGVTVVDRKLCIGCGLCVTGCPDEVARLERKPEEEIVHPPETFAVWEEMRMRERGMLD